MKTTMTKTYTISAGQYDSLLKIRGELTGHPTIEAALTALADATPYSRDELVTIPWASPTEAVAVYTSQEEADADQDGSGALAVIEVKVVENDAKDF